MHYFAQFFARRSAAWATIAAVFLVTLASLFYASRVERDDDLLAFLPRGNKEVGVFYDVSRRFGSLDVAVVGISADDVLAPDFLSRLRDVTKRLNATDGIGYAMSLANVEDFAPDLQHGGISTDYLIGKLPETDQERAALREKVMSRDAVVGNLISEDGKAALLYCFAAYKTEPKAVAQTVRAAVEQAFPKEPKYWGGAPFVSTYIYDITQDDMRRLAPWAVVVIVLITIASFRDVIGAGLALLSTAIGIVTSLGLMGALGVSVNVILGSLPVILFALGSAYPVHILSRYYILAHGQDRRAALIRTLIEVGPPVVASGLTTVVGLLSFLVMDIAPLRTFGIFTALGILITLVLSLTFVPSVIFVVRLKGKAPEAAKPAHFHEWLTRLPQRRRGLIGAIAVAVTLAGSFFVNKVDSRMDNAAFFAKNSPPDQAETFLRQHFGGSLFVQIEVTGDMTDPAVLREVRALGDHIAVLPHVSSVTHIGSVIAQINEAMESDRRIPETAAKVKLLYGFLEGKKAVTQLITDDKRHALMQVKLDTNLAADTEPLLEKLRSMTAATIPTAYVVATADGPRRDDVIKRGLALATAQIASVGRQYGITTPSEADLAGIITKQSKPDASAAAREPLAQYLGSDECTVELPGPEAIQKVAGAIVALGPKPEESRLIGAIAAALEKPADDELVTDLAHSVARPLDEVWRRAEAAARAKSLLAEAKIQPPTGPRGERFSTAIATALMDADVTTAAVAPGAGEAAQTLSVEVTGLPVMHAGLSKSVQSNQWASLLFALGLVLLIMAALFRSFWSGLLGIAPIVLTMIVIYGGMGLIGVRLDIGTSMLASLIIGAGVDYAVHLMVAWSAPEGAREPNAEAAISAARHTGPAIWVNALMVAAGFFVLTLGDARPLQNVGGLTAAAMLTAALATMMVIPLLSRKSRYYGPKGRIPEAVLSSEAPDDTLHTSEPSLHERGSR